MEALLDTWRINDRINRYLLDSIPPEALATALSKGKSVSGNLTHIHNVRLMWLKAAAPDLHEGQTKFDKEPVDHAALTERITSSGMAIEELVRRAGTPDGKIKGFKPHAAAFVGYLIAHESFHRAMVEIALRQAGIPLDDKSAYGAWEWGSR
ncbi:DinB family protein [Fimbriimonas ginsengisoli]|uniref:DinB family protein n=1 Tax=Fimbriimonas ginsengisoli Gsoil 348 TaxID=661478 RepID=A0A068NRJ7_FIMGI|nr:DinB family protein [Fimbriimonas ginsengisoli]AIE86153.1 DinB family protein [Fimbriimonas ginsengisoli Gsoil 348]